MKHPLRTNWNKDVYFSLAILLLVYAIFNLFLINKFFPITEGWFQDYSNYMKSGEIMYKDFYMFVPPGFPTLMYIISLFSGNLFIVFRIYGLIERLVLVSLVYFLLKRLFSTKITFISLLTASIIYISNVQDIFYGYYQTSLLFAILTLFFCVKLYENYESEYLKYSILFGTFAGITILFKHSTGVILSLAIGITFAALTFRRDLKKTLFCIANAVIACTVIVGIACLVMAFQGSFIPCIQQLFGGASSKGSISAILFGFFPRIVSLKSITYFACVFLCAISTRLYSKNIIFSQPKFKIYTVVLKTSSTILLLINMALIFYFIVLSLKGTHSVYRIPDYLFFAAIVFGYILFEAAKAKLDPIDKKDNLISIIIPAALIMACVIFISVNNKLYLNFMIIRDNRHWLVYAIFLLEILYSVYLFYETIINKKEELAIKLIVVVAACTIMYIHGMSYIIEDHSALLSFSIFLGTILSSQTVLNRMKNVFIYVFCVMMILNIFVQRNAFPYNWWGVNTLNPTYGATSVYDDPHLAGLKSAPSSTVPLNNIYNLINKNKLDGDTLYSFPHITYFNVMSDLVSPTFAKVHYFDVCCDDVAISDAKLLAAHPPNFIVWLDFSEEVWDIHEKFFRNGQSSGQREIKDIYDDLVSSGNYVLLGTYVIENSDPIFIWAKIDGRILYDSNGELLRGL